MAQATNPERVSAPVQNAQYTQAREQFAAPTTRPSLLDIVGSGGTTDAQVEASQVATDIIVEGLKGIIPGFRHMLDEGITQGGWADFASRLVSNPVPTLGQTGWAAGQYLNNYGAGFGSDTQFDPIRGLLYAGQHPVETLMLLDGARALGAGVRSIPSAVRAAYDSPATLYAQGLYKASNLADDTGAITIPGLKGRPEFIVRAVKRAPKSQPVYDISPLGDSRFTDAEAILPDGRSIKQALDEVTDFQMRRGQKIYNPQVYEQYKGWWREWADANPEKMEVLWTKVQEGRALADPSMTSQFNPANALRDVMNEVVRREKFANPTPGELLKRKYDARELEHRRGLERFSRQEFGVPYKQTTREMWQMYRAKKLIEIDKQVARAYSLYTQDVEKFFPNPQAAQQIIGDLANRMRTRLAKGGMRDEFGRPIVDENLNIITYTEDPATVAELQRAGEIVDENGMVTKRIDSVEGKIEDVAPLDASKSLDDSMELNRREAVQREVEKSALMDVAQSPVYTTKRLVIAGSRTIKDLDTVRAAFLESGLMPDEIISGKAGGVDTLAIDLANEMGIPVVERPASWRRADGSLDRGAGYARNGVMAQEADGALIIWDGTSPGTRNMISQMKTLDKPIWLYNTKVGELEYIPPRNPRPVGMAPPAPKPEGPDWSYYGAYKEAQRTESAPAAALTPKQPLEPSNPPTQAELPGIELVNLKKYSKQFVQNPVDGRWMMWRNEPRYAPNPVTGYTAGKGGGADMTDISGLGARAPEAMQTPLSAQEAAAQARMISALKEGDSATIRALRPVEGVRIEYIGRKWSGKLNGNNYNFEGSPLGNPFKIGDGVGRAEAVRLYREYLWTEYSKAFKGEPTPVFNAINDLLDDWEAGTPVVLVDWCAPQLCHGDIVRQLIQWVREHPTARRGQIPGIDTPYKPLP